MEERREKRGDRDKQDEDERERRRKNAENKKTRKEIRDKMAASARLTRSVDLRALSPSFAESVARSLAPSRNRSLSLDSVAQ